VTKIHHAVPPICREILPERAADRPSARFFLNEGYRLASRSMGVTWTRLRRRTGTMMRAKGVTFEGNEGRSALGFTARAEIGVGQIGSVETSHEGGKCSVPPFPSGTMFSVDSM